MLPRRRRRSNRELAALVDARGKVRNHDGGGGGGGSEEGESEKCAHLHGSHASMASIETVLMFPSPASYHRYPFDTDLHTF